MALQQQHHHADGNEEGDHMRKILDDAVAIEYSDVPGGDTAVAAEDAAFAFETLHGDEDESFFDDGGVAADGSRPSDASIDGERFVLLMPQGSVRRRQSSSSPTAAAVHAKSSALRRSTVPAPGPFQHIAKRGPAVATQTPAAPRPRGSSSSGVADDDEVAHAYRSTGGDLTSSSAHAAAGEFSFSEQRYPLLDCMLSSQFDVVSLSSSATSSRVSTPTPRLPRRHQQHGGEGGEAEEWLVAQAGDVLHAATATDAHRIPHVALASSDETTRIARAEDQERKRRRRLLIRELTDFQLLCNADREARHRVAAEEYRRACLNVPRGEDEDNERFADPSMRTVYQPPSVLRGAKQRKEAQRSCCGRWKRDYTTFMRDRIEAKAHGDASFHREVQEMACMAAQDAYSQQQETFRAQASALIHRFWQQAHEISSTIARAAVDNKEMDEEEDDGVAAATGLVDERRSATASSTTASSSPNGTTGHERVEPPTGNELNVLRSADLFLDPPVPAFEDFGSRSHPLSPLQGAPPSSSSRPLSATSTDSRHTLQFFSRPQSALAPRALAHRGTPVVVGSMPLHRFRPCSAQSTNASSVHHIPASLGSIGSRPPSATAWKRGTPTGGGGATNDPVEALERAITPAVMASVGKSVLSSACSDAMSLASAQRRQRQHRHRPSLFEEYVVGYLTLRSRMLVGVRSILQDAERAAAMGIVELEACAVREANARSGIEESCALAARVLQRNETSERQLTQSRATVNHRNRLALFTKEANHRLADVVDVYFDELIYDICRDEEAATRALLQADEGVVFAEVLRLADACRRTVLATQHTHAKQRDIWKREPQGRSRLMWLESDAWRELVAAASGSPQEARGSEGGARSDGAIAIATVGIVCCL